VQNDEDVFYSEERESDDHCCKRAQGFLEWLNRRPEKCIAVVTHSSFLRHLFQQFGGQLCQQDQGEGGRASEGREERRQRAA